MKTDLVGCSRSESMTRTNESSSFDPHSRHNETNEILQRREELSGNRIRKYSLSIKVLSMNAIFICSVVSGSPRGQTVSTETSMNKDNQRKICPHLSSTEMRTVNENHRIVRRIHDTFVLPWHSVISIATR